MTLNGQESEVHFVREGDDVVIEVYTKNDLTKKWQYDYVTAPFEKLKGWVKANE